ncbi:hypothetical protein HUJ04_003896 [Dendroctonus ponderosae]|nr:hypothetical protein HUJ04_003896 [Dendroctonus ponderosae]
MHIPTWKSRSDSLHIYKNENLDLRLSFRIHSVLLKVSCLRTRHSGDIKYALVQCSPDRAEMRLLARSIKGGFREGGVIGDMTPPFSSLSNDAKTNSLAQMIGFSWSKEYISTLLIMSLRDTL